MGNDGIALKSLKFFIQPKSLL